MGCGGAGGNDECLKALSLTNQYLQLYDSPCKQLFVNTFYQKKRTWTLKPTNIYFGKWITWKFLGETREKILTCWNFVGANLSFLVKSWNPTCEKPQETRKIRAFLIKEYVYMYVCVSKKPPERWYSLFLKHLSLQLLISLKGLYLVSLLLYEETIYYFCIFFVGIALVIPLCTKSNYEIFKLIPWSEDLVLATKVPSVLLAFVGFADKTCMYIIM